MPRPAAGLGGAGESGGPDGACGVRPVRAGDRAGGAALILFAGWTEAMGNV
jgi:hypothetical protein